jgi:hypothetical protein
MDAAGGVLSATSVDSVEAAAFNKVSFHQILLPRGIHQGLFAEQKYLASTRDEWPLADRSIVWQVAFFMDDVTSDRRQVQVPLNNYKGDASKPVIRGAPAQWTVCATVLHGFVTIFCFFF